MNQTTDILTIDLEEWFHGHNYLEAVPPELWDEQESRVVGNTDILLSMLESYNIKATFFVLGWTAERHPELVRKISDQGHEIACHSYGHPILYELSEKQFSDDLDKALKALLNAGVKTVSGYRAPSFTMTPEVYRFRDILKAKGFTYDCSIFPIMHPRYGQPSAPRKSFVADNGLLIIPMTTIRLFGMNFPFSGGGYMRLLPEFVQPLLSKIAKRQGVPVITYLHPWEIDDKKPEGGQGRLMKFRSQGGQDTTVHKLEKLFQRGKFITMHEFAENYLSL
ncbi:DUF3473 domain-containing protein [bacterium]|nr:DUF3473 domain-containing protein [bacterium]